MEIGFQEGLSTLSNKRLVGGFHPTHLKNVRQNWNLPQITVKIKHI